METGDLAEYQTQFKKLFSIEELNEFAKHHHIVEWKCAIENDNKYVYIVQYKTGKLIFIIKE